MAGKKNKKKNRAKDRPAGPRLSVCLIVRNAAGSIANWVAAAKGLGDEVVVVDTESTDGTPTHATQAGAHVFSFSWQDDYAAARNHCLDQATGDWVLFLDIDEVLARKDRREIAKALQRPDVDAYCIQTRNYTDRTHAAGWQPCRRDYPDEERGAPGWYPTHKVRLVRRKPKFRFRGRVHELVEDSIVEARGRIDVLNVPVHHYGTLDPPNREKGRYYLLLGERKVRDDPNNPRAWFELGVQAFALEEYDKAGEALGEAARLMETLGSASLQMAGHRPELVHVMQGAVRERLDDPEGAESAYRAAIVFNADAPEAYLNLSLLFERVGRLDEARPLIARAAEISPGTPQIQNALRCIEASVIPSGNRSGLRVEMPFVGPAPRLSLCMIVRNGAGTVSRAIESVRSITEEVLVLDTGSTDSTPDLCRKAGAKVFEIPWEDDFAVARNAGLERASGDWVLCLDADEVIAPQDLQGLRQALIEKDVDGYRMTTRNYTDRPHGSGFVLCTGEYPDFERGTNGEDVLGWYPSDKVRLFRRKNAYRFRECVHESVDKAILDAGGRISDLKVPVHHYGALGSAVRKEKGLRYLRLGKAKVTKSPEDPRAWYELGVQAYEIGELDEGRDAFLRTLELYREKAGRNEDILRSCGFRPDMAYVMLGAIAYRRGDRARASRHYCQALEINPEAYEAHLNLGIVFEEKGKAPEALRHYRRVLEIRPGETIAKNRLTCLAANHPGG